MAERPRATPAAGRSGALERARVMPDGGETKALSTAYRRLFAGYHWYPPLVDSRDPVAAYAQAFCNRDHAEYCRTVDPRFHEENFSRVTGSKPSSSPASPTSSRGIATAGAPPRRRLGRADSVRLRARTHR